MDYNSTGGVIDPTLVSCFLKEQVVRMEVILPPCFLLQVKEQVACMKDRMKQGLDNPAFLVE